MIRYVNKYRMYYLHPLSKKHLKLYVHIYFLTSKESCSFVQHLVKLFICYLDVIHFGHVVFCINCVLSHIPHS